MNARVETAQDWAIVPKEDIETVWPLVEGGIGRALETADGEATVADTKLGLLAGRTQLYMAYGPEGALGVVFMILAFPQFKIARVLLAFGKNMESVRQSIDAGKAWAKAQGCKHLEAWVATESRERLFRRYGMKRAYTIVRSEL